MHAQRQLQVGDIAMSRLIHHRYGGRSRRYKASPGRLINLFCPFERKPLSFRSEWVYELWLYARADPSVQSVVIRPEPLQVLDRGKCLSGAADIAVQRGDGLTYEALVSGSEGEAAHRQDALRCAAEVHGVKLRFTSPQELLDHRQLIENMERARQTLVNWLDYDLQDTCERIWACLQRGPLTRAELRAIAGDLRDSELSGKTDTCIYRLFFERKVLLDLNRRFDDECIVTAF